MLGNIEILDSRRDPSAFGLDSPPGKMTVEDLFTSAPAMVVDCKVSKWSSWSACTEDCIKVGISQHPNNHMLLKSMPKPELSIGELSVQT